MKNQLGKLIADSVFEDNKLYLLESKNTKYGFFYYNKEVYFGTNSVQKSTNPPLITNKLELHFNIKINSIEDNQTFKSGEYDFIKYKGEVTADSFDIFYKICVSYAEDQNGMSLFDFFTTIRELFEQETTGFTNLIGTIGELILIKEIYEKYKKNISDGWHRVGNFSKFDFSFDKFNIEVKSTVKDEMVYTIKHSQLFNNQKIYIAIVSLIETGTNYTLNNLIQFFSNNNAFKNNIKFQVSLSKELMKIKDPADLDRGFSLKNYSFMDKDILETIENIPQIISNIQYDYDFTGIETTSADLIFKDFN